MIQEVKKEFKESEFTFIMKKGVYKITSIERGIKPMYLALSEHQKVMNGAIIADKIIGKAAAMLAVLGKVKSIYTPTASFAAIDICEEYNIPIICDTKVPFVKNRDKTGLCPMEAITADTNDLFLVKKRVKNFLIENGLI